MPVTVAVKPLAWITRRRLAIASCLTSACVAGTRAGLSSSERAMVGCYTHQHPSAIDTIFLDSLPPSGGGEPIAGLHRVVIYPFSSDAPVDSSHTMPVTMEWRLDASVITMRTPTGSMHKRFSSATISVKSRTTTGTRSRRWLKLRRSYFGGSTVRRTGRSRPSGGTSPPA